MADADDDALSDVPAPTRPDAPVAPARPRHAFRSLIAAGGDAGGSGPADAVAGQAMVRRAALWEPALTSALRTVARAPLSVAIGDTAVTGAFPDLIAADPALVGAVPMAVRAAADAAPLLLLAEPLLVGALVDLFFGGSGIAAPVRRDAPTPVERARLSALADRFAEALGDGDPAASAVEIEAEDPWLAPGRPLAALPVTVRLDARPGAPGGGSARDLGRLVIAMTAERAEPGEPRRAPTAAERQRWRRDLARRLAEVRLPIRAVLARPTLSVGALGRLRPGDSVPLAVPRQVPLLIDNVRLGAGMLGEVEGVSAVRLDQLGDEPLITTPRLTGPS